MSPWMVVVTCLARAAVCDQIGTPDLGANNYATRAECEQSLKQISDRWKPIAGAYTFNCRRWPW